MRYIDRTGTKSPLERAKTDKNIKSLPGFPAHVAKIMETKGLAIMRTRWGVYRIIKASGLGCPEKNYPDFESLFDAADFVEENIM